MPRGFDIIDHADVDGQMLFFYDGEWHLLDPGNRGDFLVCGGPNSYPGWGTPGPLPSSSSSSSSSSFPFESSSSSSSSFEEEIWYCVDVEPQEPGCTESIGPFEQRCMKAPIVPGNCCFDGYSWYLVIGIISGPYYSPDCDLNCDPLECIPYSSSSSSSFEEPIPPFTEDCLLEGCFNVSPTGTGSDCFSCWFNLTGLIGGNCFDHCDSLGLVACDPEWYCFFNGVDYECGCCCVESESSSSSSSQEI